MYTAMLEEGKEPPIIHDQGESVLVTFLARELSVPFRMFVAEEGKNGRVLGVDHLLILRYLIDHPELDTATTARICQRREDGIREILSEMESTFGYVERGGTGKGTYWTLRREIYDSVAPPGHPRRDHRIDWEAAKTRVLSVLKQRAKGGEAGLPNAEIRAITRLDRRQVKRLMDELRAEGSVSLEGARKGAVWVFRVRK
jgi:ATP-dependent DNA helicase RecG